MRAEQTNNIRPVLLECFGSDRELLNRWHIVAGSGAEACADKTLSDLRESSVLFFRLTQESNLAGYFGKEVHHEKEYLTGFFLMPIYRTDEGRKDFWKVIEMNFKSPFYCGLYEKNIPANKFIQRHGGKPIKRTGIKDGVAVLYKIGA
jgi:hypothetical protein